jgi:hypothetical protein
MPPVQRRAEHPYRAKTLKELPDRLRALAEKTLLPDDPAEKIFVIPEQMLSKKIGGVGRMHWVPEQSLLFTQRGVIHVQAGKSGDEIGQANYLAGSSLLYAQMSLILLYGRMEICAAVNGEMSRIVVEYNAVSHEMLEPSLHKLIRLAWDQAQDQNANDYINLLLGKLEEQSLKFRNGLANHALQPNEKLLGYVFQPRVYMRYFRIMRRLIAPASLIALTDKQLIIIEDGMTGASSYGYLFTYCPRANLVDVASEPADTLQDVCIHLGKDAVMADHRLTLENVTVLAWRDLCFNNEIAFHTNS